MRAITRLRLEPAGTGPPGTLVDRYLGTSTHAGHLAWTGLPPAAPAVGITLIDTTNQPGVALPRGRPALWHLLWVRDEAAATVTLGPDGGEARWPVAPGDTVPVPVGARLRATGGQLAVAVTLPADDIAPDPPTHGTERYFGYNRRTIAFEGGGVRLCRWKLTQPLALGEHLPAPAIVLALARATVVRTAGAIERLAQGQAAVVDPAAAPVAMPDGLSYLLTIEAAPG